MTRLRLTSLLVALGTGLGVTGTAMAERGDRESPRPAGEARGPDAAARPDRRPDGSRHSQRPTYYYVLPDYWYWNPYPRYGGYPIGPLFVDPDAAGFGPGAVQRFMGVDHWFAQNVPNRRQVVPDAAARPVVNGLGVAPKQPAPPPVPQAPGPPAAAVPPPPATANGNPGAADPDAARALLYIDYGDAHFANKKYDDAMQRYRRAARLDPRLADAQLRMGFALAALGKLDQAAEAFKQGLALDSGWPGRVFTLDKLYGPNAAEKLSHRNALATASAADDRNPDLLFLLGVSYYFDGERDRAKHCFAEAAHLAGRHDAHLQPFLKRL